MQITQTQIKSLSHGMPGTKRNRRKKIKRVKDNHEMWRTCKDCGNEVDLRKELDTTNCALCGGKLK